MRSRPCAPGRAIRGVAPTESWRAPVRARKTLGPWVDLPPLPSFFDSFLPLVDGASGTPRGPRFTDSGRCGRETRAFLRDLRR